MAESLLQGTNAIYFFFRNLKNFFNRDLFPSEKNSLKLGSFPQTCSKLRICFPQLANLLFIFPKNKRTRAHFPISEKVVFRLEN